MSFVSCRGCGEQLAAEAERCPHCGALVGATHAAAVTENEPPIYAARPCPHCAATNRANAAWCNQCHQEIATDASPPNSAPNIKKPDLDRTMSNKQGWLDLRSGDNQFQAWTVLGVVMICTALGGVLHQDAVLPGMYLGGCLGLIPGLFVSGIALMIYRNFWK